jgi:hypothetical protein
LRPGCAGRACAGRPGLTVPKLRDLAGLERAAPEGKSQARPAWSQTRGAVFSGGLLALVVGLLFCAYQLWGYSAASRLTTDHSQTVITQEEEVIEQLSPSDMLDLWHEIDTHGIGPKMLPIWVAAQDAARSHFRLAIAGAVVAAAGLLASLAATFVGRGG